MIAQRQESSVQFNALTNAALLPFVAAITAQSTAYATTVSSGLGTSNGDIAATAGNRALRSEVAPASNLMVIAQGVTLSGSCACLFQESLSRHALVVYSDKHFI
jgi:hypothetical protein